MDAEKTNYNYIFKAHRKRNGAFYVSARRYGTPTDSKPEFTTGLFFDKRKAERAALVEANYRDAGLKFRFIDCWPVTDSDPKICPNCSSRANYVHNGFHFCLECDSSFGGKHE